MLFAFLHSATDQWKLESILQEYEVITPIDGKALRKAVHHFLQDFNHQLERKGSIILWLKDF